MADVPDNPDKLLMEVSQVGKKQDDRIPITTPDRKPFAGLPGPLTLPIRAHADDVIIPREDPERLIEKLLPTLQHASRTVLLHLVIWLINHLEKLQAISPRIAQAVRLLLDWPQERYLMAIVVGTSGDGFSIAVSRHRGHGKEQVVEPIWGKDYPYPPRLLQLFRKATSKKKLRGVTQPMVLARYNRFSKLLERAIGRAALDFLQEIEKRRGLTAKSISGIAWAGQTYRYEPQRMRLCLKDSLGEEEFLTHAILTAGGGETLQKMTGIPVIGGIRHCDIAAGNKGAPLAGWQTRIEFHKLLAELDLEVGLDQNWGGFGNAQTLARSTDTVVGGDTGPAAALIDGTVRIRTGQQFDEGGQLAARGKLIRKLLHELRRKHTALNKELRTTGREEWDPIIEELIPRYASYPVEDVVATVTYFVAWSTVWMYKKFFLPQLPRAPQLFVGSGGLAEHNPTFWHWYVEIARMRFGRRIIVIKYSQARQGWSSGLKEPLLFSSIAHDSAVGMSTSTPATGPNDAVMGWLHF